MNENGQAHITKADLQSALEQFFKRVVEYVDGRFAAVDERFAALDGRFAEQDGRFAGLEGRIQQLTEHFDERIYDTETKLLRAFNEFATAQDVRLRKMEANLGNLDTAATLRLAQLEAAVTELRSRVIQLEDRPR